MRRARRRERGFTLIEMMVVCAFIAVLAAIAVPIFAGEARKSKGSTEVAPMFAELSVREDQYKSDNGKYLTTPACPSAPAATGTSATGCVASGGAWTALNVQLPFQQLKCSYAITAGGAADKVTNPAGFSFTSPPMSWFYLIATCDLDGAGGTNSTYFTSSVDSTIQKQNEGK
ncbi:MAG TPA: prepilin-type N-terminal cleavage/methylation domain-containing protein [Kofleriaceae bacterium]|nr:prepilin-type N-terminal cleavage/methylation domain-containing protein [Kofleriaceae bacterium]